MLSNPSPTPKPPAARKPPLQLNLYENVKLSANTHLQRLTDNLIGTWRRSQRSVGGFWVAEADFAGEDWEMEELFRDGLMREVRETFGGQVTWQGFLADMEYTKNGVTYNKSWADLANKVQVKFTDQSYNSVPNGSVETGPWTGWLSPSLIEQSTVWKTDGDYSAHIETNSTGQGALIMNGVSIEGSAEYTFTMNTRLIYGSWFAKIEHTASSTILDSEYFYRNGEHQVKLEIPGTNALSGAVHIILQCLGASAGSGEIYADSATFVTAPNSAVTGWYEDTASQAIYGVIEDIVTMGTMHTDAANYYAQKALANRSYARITPPTSLGGMTMLGAERKNALHLTFYGYAYTLRNRFSLLNNEDPTTTTCTSVVTDELANAEFVTAGEIQSNTMPFLSNEISNRRQQWDILSTLAEIGDASYNRWEFGVGAGRLAYYRVVPKVIKGRIRNGVAYDAIGAQLDPWFVEPGYYLIDDMPIGGEHLSGDLADNQRVIFFDTVEFNAKAWAEGNPGLTFSLR